MCAEDAGPLVSQRFIRCVHCGMPHDVMQMVCPATGKAIDRRRVNSVGQLVAAERYIEPPPQPPRPPPPASKPPPPLISTMPPKGAKRDLTGKTINGKYLVRTVLGEGGMGTVFEAENLAIGRTVAIKVLHPTQARKKIAVKRFHQEARAAGAIGHPNICEVYDLGTLEDGSPYLVMEKLVGETLADRIGSEGGLPFDDVIDVLTQVLSGLVVAHEKGIVHRDIKPENIFLTKRVGCPPVAKLLDFGVSKMISPVLSGDREDDLDLTRTGMVMGTPFYMSPEQARGDRNLDARVDLYACGVILYEAITGRRPYTAANYNALLLQILTTSPRPARELRPALPLGFDEVLDKSMARHRDDRYQNAAEFQRDLQMLRDRHPKVSGMSGVDVNEFVRQARAKPMLPTAPALQPNQARPAAPPVYESPRIEEPPPEDYYDEETPSSVEIPVLFSETPLSGEQLPHYYPDNYEPPGGEDLATEVSFHERENAGYERGERDGGSDTDTTERRADLQHLSIGKRPRGTLRSAIPLAAQPQKQRSSPEFKTSDTEDDNNATLVQSASTFANLRRKPNKPSPDDTVRMDPDMTDRIREARERVSPSPVAPPPPRAPKMPR